MVEFFNFYYFMFILICAGSIVGLYFLLKNKSERTKKIVLSALLFLNLAIHFTKPLYPPYLGNANYAIRELWFINVCGVSVLFFPFIMLSKNKTWKDFMFYLGVLSGFLAMVIPTEALGKQVLTWDLWRFYTCHIIIIAAPLSMVLLKVHTIDYKRIWKMPFCVFVYFMFIITNQILQSELGLISLRGSDFFKIPYKNPSAIWGPSDDLATLFTIFTPDFMKIVPYGTFASQEKFWPILYMMPGVFVYFWVLPLLICLPWELKNIKMDIKKLYLRTKLLFRKESGGGGGVDTL